MTQSSAHDDGVLLVTLDQAARRLSVSRGTVYGLIADGCRTVMVIRVEDRTMRTGRT
jgi:hypothetical protein